VLKNDLECGGLTPLSIRPANDIGEITKNYACNQSGVKPPHSKISRSSSLELGFSAACQTSASAGDKPYFLFSHDMFLFGPRAATRPKRCFAI
jgi:hypothetical protein